MPDEDETPAEEVVEPTPEEETESTDDGGKGGPGCEKCD